MLASFGETTVVVIDQVPAVAVRTVYATSHITVFGCPPWETNCPVHAGDTQAVVTATIGATTTVCPLTLNQARLSVRQGLSPNTGGPLQTSTTRWPTLYSVPSSFPTQTSWDPAIWSSIFPTGAPAFTDSITTGSFSDGEWTGQPYPLPTLNDAQAALFGFSGYSSSGNSTGSSNGTSGTNGTAGDAAGSTGQSVTMTTGSFAAILSSNMTAYVTTLNAYTSNFSASAAGATSGLGNGTGVPSMGGSGTGVSGTGSSGTIGSGSDGLTTLWDGTVVQTGPVSLQTVNDGKAVPAINLFSLLVAMAALAIAI